MGVIDQVVLNPRALHAVTVDPGSTTNPIPVDGVPLDQPTGDDPVPPLAGVTVHVDSGAIIAPGDVVPDDGAVPAVGDVDAVLGLRAGSRIALDQEVFAKPGEDSPGRILIDDVVADRDVA